MFEVNVNGRKQKYRSKPTMNVDTTGSSGGGGVQPDWNQNNDTATDYIKNRPFYTGDPSETVFVEESTVPFADNVGIYGAEVTSTFLGTVGNTYKVYWDGVVYESVCTDYRAGLAAIGNLSIVGAGSDTGEPFIIVPDGSSIYIYTTNTSASHTISISGFAVEVIQIPDKYISNTFRDVVIAGSPRNWSENDWTKYYGLFQSGKLLMINDIGSSNSEGYVLSMAYSPRGAHRISAISFSGNLYSMKQNSESEEDKFYWAPIIDLGAFYFQYNETGSITSEAYKRLEVSDVLTFTTKNANEDEVSKKVVLEGDKEIILSSSTSGSTKKFRVTVDDSGTLSATEVT